MSTTEELMMAYAAGSTSRGLTLLCETQLQLSSKHRPAVDRYESIGGALLAAESDQEGLRVDAMSLLDRADAEEDRTPSRRDLRAGPLPKPIVDAIGIDFNAIPWRSRLRGISDHVIWDDGREKVSLMRARPGSRIPGHTHRGPEATLVMSGVMRDGDELLTVGDIALCGPEHDHHPEILGDELCYCLTVVDGGVRFTGPLGRALNFFAD